MLKEYSNAPVQEVNMAIHFHPIPTLNVVNLIGRAFAMIEHLGDYDIQATQYTEVRDESETRNMPSQFFKIGQGEPELGCRLTSPDKTSAITIQNNRFSVAWIRQQDGTYPSYEQLKSFFFKKFNVFINDLNDLGQLQPKVTQCGIQYINHVDDDNQKGFKCFNFLNIEHFQNHEGLNFSTSQRLDNKQEIGRLYLEAQTIFSLKPLLDGAIRERRNLKVSLTFRGKPETLNLDGCKPFFDRGHEAIVSTFSQTLSDFGRKEFGERTNV